jgi:hypothetical protein
MTATLRRLAGLLLIIVPIIFTVCFTLFQVQFEDPACSLKRSCGAAQPARACGAPPVTDRAFWAGDRPRACDRLEHGAHLHQEHLQ